MIKHTLPAIDKDLCFHEASFFFNLPMIGFHVFVLLGLAPIGMPNYVKGKDKRLQLCDLSNLTAILFSTSITPKQLMKKFAFRPNANSKHIIMFLTITTFGR